MDNEVSKPSAEFIKIEASNSGFESLEREFNEVLSDLDEDPALGQFRVEYEKLFRALKKSHHQEKRLVKKCRELNTEIVSNAAKVQSALKMTHEDQNTISTLRQDVSRAWSMIESSNQKEEKASDTIDQLQQHIDQLSQRLTQGDKLSIAQERSVEELIKERDELKECTDEQILKNSSIEVQLNEERNAKEQIEIHHKDLKEELAKVAEKLSLKEAEIKNESRKGERLSKEMCRIQVKLEESDLEQEKILDGSSLVKNKLSQAEIHLSDLKSTVQKLKIEYESLSKRHKKLDQDFEEKSLAYQASTTELTDIQAEFKLARAENTLLSTEKAQLERKLNNECQSIIRHKKLVDESRKMTASAQEETESNT
eukprot:CAMPEP_0194395298 /NCGR_PEP_ID=MMETSP0174-20130528/124344_1 /TAXON_ID=216777 /ORGANISM="Proboscia alata, Strain PI-D3" /LENGTH=368 /DNA_ID=CAMNT_0039191215 /DNA_START=59 /DNA_END=1165 /DNA_ORIENTATION=+